MISDYIKYGDQQFQARFSKLKIGATGDFTSSFRISGSVTGNSLVVEIFYRYYGDFVHLGVGKGTTKEDVGIARMIGGGRKKKAWKKGVGHTRHRLAELYEQNLGDALEMQVKDSMDKKIKMGF